MNHQYEGQLEEPEDDWFDDEDGERCDACNEFGMHVVCVDDLAIAEAVVFTAMKSSVRIAKEKENYEQKHNINLPTISDVPRCGIREALS